MAERRLTISELLRRVFTLDLRSLAVLRMALGLIALLDVFYYRWPHAELLLSDRGVLPRELFARIYDPSYWSFYRLSGEPTFVYLLLLVQALAAVALFAGYRTRGANVILLILCWSQSFDEYGWRCPDPELARVELFAANGGPLEHGCEPRGSSRRRSSGREQRRGGLVFSRDGRARVATGRHVLLCRAGQME